MKPRTLAAIILSIIFILMKSPSSAGPGKLPPKQRAFDSLYSAKQLGCIAADSQSTFRLFAPRAMRVTLVLFDRFDQETGEEFAMTRDSNGVWEYTIKKSLFGKYYGYRILGPIGNGEMFNPKTVIADPYSKAVATKNNYHHPAKTLILKTDFDWGGDTFVVPGNHDDLIIYEAHLRDLTAHPSSGVSSKGTYIGMTEKGKTGGLSYLKTLGVNAIEFLPLQEFGNIELPYRDKTAVNDSGEVNTWNPYERNHWGYMTSYFFAPESYYATDGSMERDKYDGSDGRAVKEFKTLVKTLHREGIAVIMDVVYNHVSQYDYNPFKYIDKFYYFHTDSMGDFVKASGCGNDFYTERPMARRLIVESVKYWMQEYHVDGFRFDLATMIDWTTCKKIVEEARKINPNVILIAEPWGGGKYDLKGFSDIGWASWNDQIRNGVKGQNPRDGLGFIFGKFQGSNTKKSLMSYVTGSLREDGGPYLKKEHSINYLESHDDNTLGDFIRLGTGEVKDTQRITDTYHNARLSSRQLALNKLAALFLFTSQGPVMMGEGQEFARSKVIAPTSAPDPNVGRLDHNSYDKDNETNYLNYLHRPLNQDLFDYYKGLIALRRSTPCFGSAPKKAIEFLPSDDKLLISFTIDEKLVPGSGGRGKFLVIMNGNPDKRAVVRLPVGEWGILANNKRVSPKTPIRSVSRSVDVPATSGMILVKD